MNDNFDEEHEIEAAEIANQISSLLEGRSPMVAIWAIGITLGMIEMVMAKHFDRAGIFRVLPKIMDSIKSERFAIMIDKSGNE